LRLVGVGWRVIAAGMLYTSVYRAISLLSGESASLSSSFVQSVVIDFVIGSGYALILLPLARRLPYRGRTRVVAIFIPLYWIALLSNLVEAYFLYWIALLSNLVEAYFTTTFSRVWLIVGAVILAIPVLVTGAMIAGLFPAYEPEQPPLSIWRSLSDRSLLSWTWRILLVGIVFAAVLELLGNLYDPIIAKYYSDPAFMSQTHVLARRWYVGWPDEFIGGVLFALSLLPVLAVVRGRDTGGLAALAVYVALVNAAFESWLALLSQTSWPLQFRLGEGLGLTSDAVVRGILVAAILALPSAATAAVPASARSTEHS
jgi:hypothetical protein